MYIYIRCYFYFLEKIMPRLLRVVSNGEVYPIQLCFSRLIYCTVDVVRFEVNYYSRNGRRYIKREVQKHLHSEEFISIIASSQWCSNEDDDQGLKHLLEVFFKECNYTFLHYQNTIDYLQTDIGYYLAKYHRILINDDLIWYALFSTLYSGYNFSQNLTNLKYKKQYDYGYLTDDDDKCS